LTPPEKGVDWNEDFFGGRKVFTKNYFVGLALLFCTILIVGCPPSNNTGQATSSDLVKQRLQRQIDGDYKNPDLHYQMGKMHQATGLWSQSEHEFTVALSFDPVHRPSQAAMVKILLDSGQAAKAKLSADFYMNQASTSEIGSLELGIAFQNEVLDDYALTCYMKALSIAPTSAKANKQLGFFYLRKGDNEKAKGYLIRSFQSDPYQSDVAGELGRLGVAIQPSQTPKPKAIVAPDAGTQKK
jgi:tetratricopeptide (TPR) repeat protein